MKERLIRKFEGEIAALDRELKLELPKEIKRARELGDLRENAEYAAAKERQRLVEARISMLKKRVSEIAIMNVDRIPHDRAGFGSTVHVVESNGEKQVFQLVMPEDADAAKGLISTTSPLGRAFLNKEAGDAVKVTTPGGNREFEIVKLISIPRESYDSYWKADKFFGATELALTLLCIAAFVAGSWLSSSRRVEVGPSESAVAIRAIVVCVASGPAHRGVGGRGVGRNGRRANRRGRARSDRFSD